MSEFKDVFHASFAYNVAKLRYLHDVGDTKETWSDLSKRVSKSVMGAVDAPKELVAKVERAILNREFLPGGRYLYAAGRPYHQTNNCLLLRASDSREGWAELTQKAMMALMTGAGIGVVYSDVREKGRVIRKTGGLASGPLSLAKILNETGREVMQGGARRSALWAGIHWWHPDAMDFIKVKEWSSDIKMLKAKDFNAQAPLDMTNVSIILDDDFFDAFHNAKHPSHTLATTVYWESIARALETGEPGLSVNVGKDSEFVLRNAPVSAETWVMTNNGYRQVGSIVDTEVTVWTGKQWANTTFRKTKTLTPTVKVTMTGGREITADPSHEFLVEKWVGRGKKSRKLVSIDKVPAGNLVPGQILHVSLPSSLPQWVDVDSYILGYTYGDGSFCKRYDNRAEITFCTDESKKCSLVMRGSELVKSVTEVDARGYIRMYLVSDLFCGRNKVDYPSQYHNQASLLAGLFDADGSYDPNQHRVRLASVHKTFLEGARRALETLGIQSSICRGGTSTLGKKLGWLLVVNSSSVNQFARVIPTQRLNVGNHESYRQTHIKVVSVTEDVPQDVYCCDVGVEEHSFVAEGVVISNCTEVVSDTTDDICNIGSINMAKVSSVEHMNELVDVGISFLLAGSVYSDVPYPDVEKVRAKNRLLGLGLMGLHEWLLTHGKRYGPDPELEKYLEAYAASGEVAKRYARKWKLSVPKRTRAIAPNGTTSIVAETSGGIEPIFAVAYKRRYYKGQEVSYEYVVDPVAKRLIDGGIQPESIEDAYSLAENMERRVEFQAWIQKFVDHSIASTVNLPPWGTENNNASTVRTIGTMLMKYLPQLRGITFYPDGARGGQPLTTVSYKTAIAKIGHVFEEQADVCSIANKGSCGA